MQKGPIQSCCTALLTKVNCFVVGGGGREKGGGRREGRDAFIHGLLTPEATCIRREHPPPGSYIRGKGREGRRGGMQFNVLYPLK